MSYSTLLECGRELLNDITSGLISEAELTASGRTKLQLWRESPNFVYSTWTDGQLAQSAANAGVVDVYKYTMIRAEQDYRAANKSFSVTELLLEDDDE